MDLAAEARLTIAGADAGIPPVATTVTLRADGGDLRGDVADGVIPVDRTAEVDGVEVRFQAPWGLMTFTIPMVCTQVRAGDEVRIGSGRGPACPCAPAEAPAPIAVTTVRHITLED